MDTEGIQKRFDNARVLAAMNHSIGPTVLASLNDMPVLFDEIEDYRDAIRLVISCSNHFGPKWTEIPDSDVDGYLNRIRELKQK